MRVETRLSARSLRQIRMRGDQHSRHGLLSLMTCGYRSPSTAWAILRRGVGPDGAVVPRDLPVGGESHETFTDGAMASVVPRGLSHRASSG